MKIFFFLVILLALATVQAHDVCLRSDAIRKEIESQLQKNCNEITSEDLLNIKAIEIESEAIKNGTTLVGDFDGLSNLISLELGGNQLHHIQDGVFDSLDSLKRLGLAGCRLPPLPEKLFSKLENLESLSLSWNGYYWIDHPLPEGIFGELRSLKELYLNDEWINFYPEKIFQNLGSLEILEMQYNRISFIDVDQKKAVSAKIFWSLNKLKHLDLSYSTTRLLPKDVFKDLSSLEVLDLEGARLTQLTNSSFKNLRNLELLNLRFNRFQSIGDKVFTSSVFSNYSQVNFSRGYISEENVNMLRSQLNTRFRLF